MSSALTWIADCFTVHAESTVTVPSTPSNTESVSPKPDPSEEKAEPEESDDDKEESEEKEDEDEEEEEEEEEEAEDQKPAIVEACESSKACAPLKHHFDECQERVLGHSGDDENHENCVEEMFHLMHCVDQCMAPKLFAQLK
jgi:ubiquinol-cytochrome c reductase subunit 6